MYPILDKDGYRLTIDGVERVNYGGKSTPSILNDPGNNNNERGSTLLSTLTDRFLPSLDEQGSTTRDTSFHFAKCKKSNGCLGLGWCNEEYYKFDMSVLNFSNL